MASVQEILMQIEGQKSPFIHFLEGAAGGFSSAQDQALQRAQALMEMEQQRQQMIQRREIEARQAEFNRQMQQRIAAQAEGQTKNELNATGTTKPVLPTQKLKEKISRDEKGNYSQTFETVDTTPKAPDVPNSYEEVLAQQYREGKITLDQFSEMKKKASASSMPSFQIVGSQDGNLVAVNPKTLESRPVGLPGKGPLTSTTQTEGQANAKLYAKRLEEANKQLDDLTSRVDLTSVGSGIQGKLPNLLKSEDIQLFEQSKRNFLNAVLRRESGAVISSTEFADGNKQYFPVVGDTQDVLKQKALNRKTALEGIRNAAGEFSSADSMMIGRFKVTVEP